jgi:hypothetical protein
MQLKGAAVGVLDRHSGDYRLHIALLWSAFFFLWAAMRPLDVGHDTSMYAGFIEQYMRSDGERYPDFVFDLVASATASVFSQFPGGRENGGRVFLVFIALVESVLMFMILTRKKNGIEATLLALSFGPLMFLDFIRQGMSMLFAGVYFSGKARGRLFLLLGALATHIISIVSLFLIPLNKKNVKILAVFLCSLLVVYLLAADRLQDRFDFYEKMRYFYDISEFQSLTDVYSFLNIVVLLFLLYGSLIGGFTKRESIVLIVFYVVNIYFPLFYRLYLFYFFCVACSRDMFMSGRRITHLIFNIGYVVVLLRFSLGPFLYE